MRIINKIKPSGLLLFSLSLISLGCSSKSREARLSEDEAEMSRTREDIKKTHDNKALEDRNKTLNESIQRLNEIQGLRDRIIQLTKERDDATTKYEILLKRDCGNSD